MVGLWRAGVVSTAAAVVAAGCGGDSATREGATRIAFTANQGGRESVVVVAADGRRRVRLQRDAGSPAWSPDGGKLAFVRDRDGAADIAVMADDGSGLRAVTSGPAQDSDPAFSPDGRWIAFARVAADGAAAIHVVRTDGSELRAVTGGDGPVAQPAWSPDSSRIAFTRVSAGAQRIAAHVQLVDAHGGGERRLVEGHTPAWAPDGRRLAYVSRRDRHGRTCFHDCMPSGEIHTIGADGRRDRRLTRSRADDDDPAWAAGGRQIVFSSDRADRARHDRELYAMSATGGCVTRLTNASSWSLEPAWAPSGAGGAPCSKDRVAAGARQSVVDVDLRPARGFSAHALLWLGRTHRGLLLSHAEGFEDDFSFVYDDCERPGCPPGDVQVQNRRLCWWRHGPAPVRLRRIGSERGAPVYAIGTGSGEEATAEVHTGDAAVRVAAPTRRGLRSALAALRPLTAERGRRLAPPARRCR